MSGGREYFYEFLRPDYDAKIIAHSREVIRRSQELLAKTEEVVRRHREPVSIELIKDHPVARDQQEINGRSDASGDGSVTSPVNDK